MADEPARWTVDALGYLCDGGVPIVQFGKGDQSSVLDALNAPAEWAEEQAAVDRVLDAWGVDRTRLTEATRLRARAAVRAVNAPAVSPECPASISGRCLDLTQGFGPCPPGECNNAPAPAVSPEVPDPIVAFAYAYDDVDRLARSGDERAQGVIARVREMMLRETT